MNRLSAQPLLRLFMRSTATGWMVEGPGGICGPLPRLTALDLAQGMIDAARQAGQAAELVIEG